jgi:ribose transport system ATP-binding protein
MAEPMDQVARPEAEGASGPSGTQDAVDRPVLEMRGISKSFFGVPVLVGVDIDCRPGEVHAILGENGAGKSTLMKILSGAYQPDRGKVILDGKPVRFGHPHDAQVKGVSIIYQEFNLLPERTVAQNIFLGREHRRRGLVDRAAMERATIELLELVDPDRTISPQAQVKELSVAQQQTVEIAKALSFRSTVLIMDEPTAALAPAEVAALFDRVRRLQERGLAIIYISHRLKEIFEIAQRVTVLKDGLRVGTVDVGSVTTGDLVRMMVGRDLDHYFPSLGTPHEIGVTRLAVRGGSVAGRVHDVDLEVRAGEIVGLAGLAGCGRTDLSEAVFGVRPFTKGTIEIDGAAVDVRSPRQAIARQLGFVVEDRKADGLVLVLSVRDNALLALRSMGGWFRQPGGQEHVRELARRVDLRAASLDQEVRYLSGGNQQKVVLTKWLATGANILIFDEPTRGIDVGAKAGIHELMRELARAGAAILMSSSELPEIIGMSDRILVMRNGAIAGQLPAGASEADIMLLATGEQDIAGVA